MVIVFSPCQLIAGSPSDIMPSVTFTNSEFTGKLWFHFSFSAVTPMTILLTSVDECRIGKGFHLK